MKTAADVAEILLRARSQRIDEIPLTRMPFMQTGTNSSFFGNCIPENTINVAQEVIVAPKNKSTVNCNNSTLEILLKTEKRAKQKAPSKTQRLTSNPENCTASNSPFVMIMQIPPKPVITAIHFEIERNSLRIKLANKIICKGHEYWIMSTSMLLPLA